MSTVIQYPDGVDIQTSRPKFLPVMLAAELQVAQITGNDLSWYYSHGFTLSCCLRQLSSGRFSILSYGE